MTTLQGIAARLHEPMLGKPVKFGRPGPFPLRADAPVDYRGRQVGRVLALWVEEDRVHWIGQLDPAPLSGWDADPESPLRVPMPDPAVLDLIQAIQGAWLVGVPALTEARTEREGDCMVLTDWTVPRMQLLRPADAPWPGLILNVR